LLFEQTGKIDLKGFVDSDWGNDVFDRKSYSDLVFLVANGLVSPVTEKKKKKTFVAIFHPLKQST